MALGHSLSVTFELVTPAYAGAADRRQTDGLRPPTLKGLLRFWWRAIHPELKGSKLFTRESEIFGSTDKGQGLRVVPVGPWREPRCDPVGTVERDPVHGYMAYGAVAWEATRGQPELQVPRIHANESMSVRLELPSAARPSDVEEIERALWAMSAFGGIGSRSRRGLGSLRVRYDFPEPLKDPHGGSSPEETAGILREGLKSLLARAQAAGPPAGDGEPLHAALSLRTRALLGSRAEDAYGALRQAKDAFSTYRRLLGAGARGMGPGAGVGGP